MYWHQNKYKYAARRKLSVLSKRELQAMVPANKASVRCSDEGVELVRSMGLLASEVSKGFMGLTFVVSLVWHSSSHDVCVFLFISRLLKCVATMCVFQCLAGAFFP